MYRREANGAVMLTGAETLMQELLDAVPCSAFMAVLQHQDSTERLTSLIKPGVGFLMILHEC